MITAGIPSYRYATGTRSTVEVCLASGFSLYAHPGSMVYKGRNIDMTITTGGGWGAAFRRLFSGQSALLPSFTNHGKRTEPVAFTRNYPGECVIIPMTGDLQTLFAQKHTFLFASANTDVSVGFHKKLSVGVLGPDGLLLQKFVGQDAVVGLYASGNLIEIELEAGDSIDVDLGSVLAFTDSVQYKLRSVGTLERGALGGEGIWLFHLQGPGRVYLQDHPPWSVATTLSEMSTKAEQMAR